MARTTRTPKRKPAKKNWRPAFLAALGESGLVIEACRIAAVGRSTAYDERQRNEDFALAWADAIEAATAELEQVAIRRAKEGSDTLMIFLLKARKPEVYREVHQHAHAHAGRVQHQHNVDLSKLDDEELEEWRRLRLKAEH